MPLKFIEKEKKSKPLNDDILTMNVRDQNFEAMNSGRNKKGHSCTACVNSSSFVSTELKINCYLQVFPIIFDKIVWFIKQFIQFIV